MRKFACTLFFVLLAVLAFASVSAAVTVKVDPATKELPDVGTTFNVDIVIDDVTDLGGFEFDLQYDASIVTIENSSDVSLGDFLGSTGQTASLLGPSIDNNVGLLEAGGFSFGSQAGPNGSGILIKITFSVQSFVSGTLDLKNVILADTSANSITVDITGDGILKGNQDPIADAGPDQTVDEDVTVTLDGSNSSDPDGDDDIASYLWEQIEGITVTLSDTTEVQRTFTAPDVGPDGESLTFELTVEDYGGLTDTDTCIVNVTWENEPPIADAGPDQTVDEGVTVTLDGSNSSDPDYPDDDVAFYEWTQTDGSSVTLSDSEAVQPTFTAPDVGADGESLTFQLTVTDYGGLRGTDTCVVNISYVLSYVPPTDGGGGGCSCSMSDPEGNTGDVWPGLMLVLVFSLLLRRKMRNRQ